MLRGEDWYLFTAVSGQPIGPIFKGQSSSSLRIESPLWRFIRFSQRRYGGFESSGAWRRPLVECNPTFRSIGCCVFVVKVKMKLRKSITPAKKKTRQIPQYPNPCSSPYSQNPTSKPDLDTDKFCPKVRSLFIYNLFRRTQIIILPNINTDGRILTYNRLLRQIFVISLSVFDLIPSQYRKSDNRLTSASFPVHYTLSSFHSTL